MRGDGVQAKEKKIEMERQKRETERRLRAWVGHWKDKEI